MRKQIGKIKNLAEKRRHRRIISIRNKISGTAEIPRVFMIKSNKHLAVQVVDDQKEVTLFSAGTFGKNAPEGSGKSNESAKNMGIFVAKKLKDNGINHIVFDRKGYKYTGKIAVFVSQLRENGIQV
ncbi:MAG: 50S ribosomal protein L18 [Bdellovibrionales bacterium RIFOXYA1_FULL_36_14]|nr:MAG: 50S ribosomal protein L18 [Bdellovibrionales bacterium RIFOXYA1_FULL_36_14]